MKKLIPYTFIVLVGFVSLLVFQSCENDEVTTASPIVKSFTPEAGGPIGTYVKITGSYFSSTLANNTVEFNGIKAEVLSASASVLMAIVPAGATSGKISVTVGSHSGSSSTDYAVSAGTPVPVILAFDPNKGNDIDGVTVTLAGLNFSTVPGDNEVRFNGIAAATPTEVSARSLKVVVPAGATTGKITVKVAGVTEVASSGSDFTIPEPTVASFTPTFSAVGATVVITGTNFSKTAGNNVVKFGDTTAATPSVASETSLTVIVPAGATTGKISVSVGNQSGISKYSFEVN